MNPRTRKLIVKYKRVVARKIRLTRRLTYFVYRINEINKRMKYLTRGVSIRRQTVALIWSDGVVG